MSISVIESTPKEQKNSGQIKHKPKTKSRVSKSSHIKVSDLKSNISYIGTGIIYQYIGSKLEMSQKETLNWIEFNILDDTIQKFISHTLTPFILKNAYKYPLPYNPLYGEYRYKDSSITDSYTEALFDFLDDNLDLKQLNHELQKNLYKYRHLINKETKKFMNTCLVKAFNNNNATNISADRAKQYINNHEKDIIIFVETALSKFDLSDNLTEWQKFGSVSNQKLVYKLILDIENYDFLFFLEDLACFGYNLGKLKLQ